MALGGARIATNRSNQDGCVARLDHDDIQGPPVVGVSFGEGGAYLTTSRGRSVHYEALKRIVPDPPDTVTLTSTKRPSHPGMVPRTKYVMAALSKIGDYPPTAEGSASAKRVSTALMKELSR